MGLPWVRLDTNIYTHDKFLALLDDPSREKWPACVMYVFGLAYSASHETDGYVPSYALKVIQGTPQRARLLVKYGLWDEGINGWAIRNYGLRQQLSDETYTIRKAQVIGGQKGACVRHHGPDCGCWRKGGETRALGR